MDQHEMHLVLNHIPVILTVMALAASLLAIVKKSRAAWVYAAASLTVAGLFTYPTFFTGHGTHEILENYWWVKADSWADHEAAADWAVWITCAAGLVGAYAWWKLTRAKDAMITTGVQVAVIVACLFAATTMGRTAWLGGKVIRDQESLQKAPPGWVAPPKMEHDNH